MSEGASERGSESKADKILSFGDLNKKFYIWLLGSVFLFLMLYFM